MKLLYVDQKVFNLKMLLLFLLFPGSIYIFGQKSDNVVLRKKVDVSIRHQTLVSRTELLIQINSKTGEEIAEFSMNYSPKFKINKLAAWIQDTTGQVIRRLEKKQIKSRNALYGPFYTDQMIQGFELKYNHYPYQVHVEYTTETDEFMFIANWSPIYTFDSPTILATLSLETPVNYPVQILNHKIDAPIIDTVDGTIYYKWTSHYLHLIKEETSQPSYEDLCSFVYIVPRDFEYGTKGSCRSWETFGDYIEDLMQNQGALPESEIRMVQSLTSGMDDTLAMIRKLFHYLQDNTRYINVSVDIGGMRPYPPSYVAQNKYGDCKALTSFMKSLLEVAGIPSFYSLVYGDYYPRTIERDFPSQQFNHAILCLPYKSDTLWLDCTSKDLPLGYTSVFIQGRPALVVTRGKSRLVTIPFLKTQEVAVNHTYRYSEFDNENMDVTIHDNFKGRSFEDLVSTTISEPTNKQKEFARDLLPFSDFELQTFAFTRKSKDDLSVSFDAHVKVKGELKALDDRVIFTPPSSGLPNFEKIQARENPVFYPYPIWRTDTVIIAIPSGMIAKSLPSVEFSCNMGVYTVSSRLDHNDLIHIRELLIRRGLIGLDQYQTFYNWIGSINSFERQNKIIFVKKHE